MRAFWTATRGSASPQATTPSSSGRFSAGLRRRDIICSRTRLCRAIEAERIGLVALAVPDGKVLDAAFDTARTLAAGSATAMRWTKHALNNWLRLAGPSFDTSLALEFLGFRLADVREGLAAARGKRPADFERRQEWMISRQWMECCGRAATRSSRCNSSV